MWSTLWDRRNGNLAGKGVLGAGMREDGKDARGEVEEGEEGKSAVERKKVQHGKHPIYKD